MNRSERRRHAAELRAVARSHLKLADLGHVRDGWGCDCTCCRLIRAGVCLQCAALLTAQIIESKAGDTVNAALCSAACREGAERFVAERPVEGAAR